MSEARLFEDRFGASRDPAPIEYAPEASDATSLAGAKVLVTGATGFVGAAVARRLAGTGCFLRTLVRPTSPRGNLEELDIELFEGDMRDARAVGAAMKGVRYLFHVAADYRLWALDPSEILATNELGTRIVMDAALQAGVERIVHTSSVATLKPCCNGSPSCEGDRLNAQDAIGAYKRSKILSELFVDRMVAEKGLPAIIVCPSTPIGPGDIKPTPTGRIIVEAAHGRIPAFVETGLNLVHVDDVADGHIRALEHGRVGERYILGGQNVGFGTMLANIAALTSRRAPKIRVPHNAIYPIAYAAEMMAQMTKREPFVSLDSLRMSKHLMYYSSQKAEHELGYRARSYHRGVEDAVLWFSQRGYLPAVKEGSPERRLRELGRALLKQCAR